MPRVYVVNRGGHNLDPAREFGEVKYLSEGRINVLATGDMYRDFEEKLLESEPDDFLVPTGMSVMSIIAACLFVKMHNRLNLLIFKGDRYEVRRLGFQDTKARKSDESETQHDSR